jgi:hypothetical protein
MSLLQQLIEVTNRTFSKKFIAEKMYNKLYDSKIWVELMNKNTAEKKDV